MKKSVWIGIQNKERSVTLHGSLLSVWAGCVCCLLNHGNNPVSPPSLCRGSQCLLSINWNVRGLTKTTFNECQQLLQVASDHAAATAALTAASAALQHRLQTMRRYEAQSICLHYALTMNTIHYACTLSTNSAAMQHCRPGGGHLRWNETINTSQHQPSAWAKWYAAAAGAW